VRNLVLTVDVETVVIGGGPSSLGAVLPVGFPVVAVGAELVGVA